jgi:uncharacterized protein YqgC (DUF456 family)
MLSLPKPTKNMAELATEVLVSFIGTLLGLFLIPIPLGFLIGMLLGVFLGELIHDFSDTKKLLILKGAL